MVSDPRPQQAVDLRLAGLSRSQIQTALGLRSSKLLTAWLQGVPPPAWTERPRAKDELRAHALALRLEGKSYNDIRAQVGVSKSTLSLWLRDVPLTDEHRLALEMRSVDQRSQARHARRLRRNQTIMSAACDEIAELSERELFIAGLVAYWAEGAKNKPGGPNRQVSFINSDPAMIRLFLAWLALLGIGSGDLTFRVSIHESGAPEDAEEYWADCVGVDRSVFRRTTLKRHNPKTNRTNVGADYRGCLTVGVKRSSDLNLMIAGWYLGLAEATGTMIRTSGMV